MIVFYGASVTQQKNGYAVKFKEQARFKVKILGYGGMHLDDAGIIYLDKVIELKPKYCFIDFFTTDYKHINKETKIYLDTIVYRLYEIHCTPIFLFLPRRDEKNREKFYQFCKNYLNNKNIRYIDIRDKLKIKDYSTILRDIVHTKEKGSYLYAKLLINFFSKLSNSKKDKILTKIKKTNFINIKKLSVNRTIYDYIKLDGNCMIIAFELIVGPHSGFIEIKEKKSFEINTWDKYCYYNRPHLNLKKIYINGETTFKILNKTFNTDICKENINFSKKDKKLIIGNIYYIGNALDIKNTGKTKRKNDILTLFIENKFYSIRKKITRLLK